MQTRSIARKESPLEEDFAAAIRRLKALPREQHVPVSQQHAAVLVALFQGTKGEVRVLLTRRSPHLRAHGGEVCLPGGKREKADADDTNTALREAFEEVALDPQTVTVVGQLCPFLSKHGLSVTPVVGLLQAAPHLQPNIAEVDAVFDMPLKTFLAEAETHSFQDITQHGISYRLHWFEHGDFRVWGLTAGILIHVAKLAYGQLPAFQESAPGMPPLHKLSVIDGKWQYQQ